MGTRGPRTKPTELKELEGNPGKRRLNNKPVYDLTDKCRRPPPYLGSYAKKEWKRVLPLLDKNGLMTDADYIALAAYCQAVDTWIVAEKAKRAHGLTDITDKGNVIQRPEVGVANSALQNILKFGREFGLTPSSRADFDVDKAENSDNPLLSLMKRKNDRVG